MGFWCPTALVNSFQLWRKGSSTAILPPTIEDFANATHLPLEQARELESLVLSENQRQLVFEGPPGSGKTFVADKLARFLTGNRLEGPTNDQYVTVQFHQSYGYEDFVQGIRPETDEEGQLRYELRDGVFKALCDRARLSPDEPFIILIDEINRGNISRILGELLFVLEYRDQAVQLAYSPPNAEPFTVPANVLVFGTMNTTDRSLAQIDYALRRRFYFYRFMPVENGKAPVLRSWLERNGDADPDAVIELFLSLNSKVEEQLGKHFQVGHSYFMKNGMSTDAVQRKVWRHAIMPLLEEYFYNRPDLESLLREFEIDALMKDSGPASTP